MAWKYALDLSIGDRVICMVNGSVVESVVKVLDISKEKDEVLLSLESGDILAVRKDHIFNRSVINLVPKEKQCFHKRCAVEVLCFYTDFEYEHTELESDLKKCIFGKFRNYYDGLEYAQRMALSNGYSHVLIRA